MIEWREIEFDSRHSCEFVAQIELMENAASEIYDLVSSSPQMADQRAKELLVEAKSQDMKDSLNWARAYALVELKKFEEAEKIWSDIFARTNNHMALHQIGYVQRSSGRLEIALQTYLEESNLLSSKDIVAIGANLYELTYCSHLLGNKNEALLHFRKYEELEFEQPDLIERGCFFRLKGDILLGNDRGAARGAYLKSLDFFQEAQDELAASEIQDRLLKS